MTKPPTTTAILKKAAKLITSPLPHTWACCEYDLGPYCPRCAIAFAKGQLTRTQSFMAGDGALEWAREEVSAAERKLGLRPEMLSQEDALAVIKKALVEIGQCP